MRTSLNKIKVIEDYLSGIMAPDEAVLFEANLLLDNDLVSDMQHQQNTYAIIKRYSRQKIKDEIIAVQKVLTAEPQHRGFMRRISNLFKTY